MFQRPIEFWVALIAGMLIVIERHKEKPMVARALIAAISGGIGYSMAPEVAAYTGRSEVLAVMVLTTFGYLVIDLTTSLIQDRDFVKDIVKSRLGKGGDK